MNYIFFLIPIISALILVAGGFVFFRLVSKRLQNVSLAMFGTRSLVEGVKRHQEEAADTPKSVAGMTKIHMPQIMADFPEFSLPEFIHKSENQLKGALTAIDAGSLASFADASDDLKEQIRVRIAGNRQSGIRERFGQIRIHQTEVGDYQKLSGSCVIILQSAVEYIYARERNGKSSEAPKRIQTKYNLYLMYVQDEKLMGTRASGKSTICPQCGAPVNRLGNKKCEYCGSYVEPINIRSWALTKIKEV